MKWERPPDLKIYEALGAVADGRVHAQGNSAQVFSSSGNKYYDVRYDPEKHLIAANDNGSFYNGYLGYPSIAFLMVSGVIPYNATFGERLKNIPWKDINTKTMNSYEKTLDHVLQGVSDEDKHAFDAFVVETQKRIAELDLALLGEKQKPPAGY